MTQQSIIQRGGPELNKALQKGDRTAFEQVYHAIAPNLLQHINQRIRNREASEEIVQEIFLSLWIRRNELEIHTDLKAYLYGAAKFQVLNFIRSAKTHQKYIDHLLLFIAQREQSTPEQAIYARELATLVDQFTGELPPKCRKAFQLSRFEHKSIPEIAEEMGISTRTVENYLTQALKHLRTALARHAWLVVLAAMG